MLCTRRVSSNVTLTMLIKFVGFIDEYGKIARFNIAKLWNQVPPLDHFVVQNSGDFLCWKYKKVVCFYVSNLRQKSATEKSTVNQYRADYCLKLKHKNTQPLHVFNRVRVLHLGRLKEGTWLHSFAEIGH